MREIQEVPVLESTYLKSNLRVLSGKDLFKELILKFQTTLSYQKSTSSKMGMKRYVGFTDS